MVEVEHGQFPIEAKATKYLSKSVSVVLSCALIALPVAANAALPAFIFALARSTDTRVDHTLSGKYAVGKNEDELMFRSR